MYFNDIILTLNVNVAGAEDENDIKEKEIDAFSPRKAKSTKS